MNFLLPEQSHVHKSIPKNKFFEKAIVNTKLKRAFADTVQKITWEYKLAEGTIGIPKAGSIEEIQIFEIQLKQQIIPKNILRVIDKSIPYPILYVFTYDEQTAYGMAEKGDADQRYYFSAWGEEPLFCFTGANLERVYQGLITAFIGEKPTSERDFAMIVERDRERGRLERQITIVKNKLKREPQFNKKVVIQSELRSLKKRLEEIIHA